jgi:hypothetical protein
MIPSLIPAKYRSLVTIPTLLSGPGLELLGQKCIARTEPDSFRAATGSGTSYALTCGKGSLPYNDVVKDVVMRASMMERPWEWMLHERSTYVL